MTDETNPPAPTPEDPPAPVEPDADEATGYAVYDHTLRRFVGRVKPGKREAERGVAKVKTHRYETRKV